MTFNRQNSHAKTECLKPEQIQPSVTYAFNVAPDDTMQHFDDPDRLKHFKEVFYGYLLKNVAKYAHYNLNIEVSEGGRLHGHGTIQIHDVLNFYLYAIPSLKQHNTYVIKPMDDQWETTYCIKQKHIFGGKNPTVNSKAAQYLIIQSGKSKTKLAVQQITNTIDSYMDI